MSTEWTAWAWEQQLRPVPKLLLLAIADQVAHTGVAIVSAEYLAGRTGLNVADVENALGQISHVGVKDHKNDKWVVTLEVNPKALREKKVTPKKEKASGSLDKDSLANNSLASRSSANRSQASNSQSRLTKNYSSNTGSRKRASPRTTVPDEFPITERMATYAHNLGFTDREQLEEITEDFQLWHRSKGTKYSDWYAAWQQWLRKQLKIDREKRRQAEAPTLNVDSL